MPNHEVALVASDKNITTYKHAKFLIDHNRFTKRPVTVVKEVCFVDDVYRMLSENIGDERLGEVFSDIGGIEFDESILGIEITDFDAQVMKDPENLSKFREHYRLKVVKVVNFDTNEAFYYSRSLTGHLVGIQTS